MPRMMRINVPEQHSQTFNIACLRCKVHGRIALPSKRACQHLKHIALAEKIDHSLRHLLSPRRRHCPTRRPRSLRTWGGSGGLCDRGSQAEGGLRKGSGRRLVLTGKVQWRARIGFLHGIHPVRPSLQYNSEQQRWGTVGRWKNVSVVSHLSQVVNNSRLGLSMAGNVRRTQSGSHTRRRISTRLLGDFVARCK